MKNIVLCFDGTESKFGPAPYTNLLKIFRMLAKDDTASQISYYQPGIGASMTVDYGSLWDIVSTVQNSMDSLLAFSLDNHIIEAYTFLMRVYNEGDKIFMFGFSRGAFTARVLSSMIERVGLLNEGLEELVSGAWSIYTAWEYAAQPSQPDYTTTLVDEFKKTFSRGTLVEIEFLGLFDCVNSVGLLRDRMFPFTSRLSQIKYIRHAVSLDERRGKYKQNLLLPHSYKQTLIPPTFSTSSRERSVDTSRRGSYASSSANGFRLSEAKKLMKDLEERLIKASRLRGPQYPRPESIASMEIDRMKLLSGEFQEIWFPGNHGDVGGGWSSDVNGQFISNLPLRWMLAEAIKCGVQFQKDTVVVFSQRYSSLDSMLSCQHDALSLCSHGLTHKVSRAERNSILELSNELSRRKSSPYFRSCEIPVIESLDQLFTNSVYLNSLKRFELDSSTDSHVFKIFNYFKSLPEKLVRGLDGRGTNPILVSLAWWVVEVIPLGTKIENSNCRWRNVYYPNLGRSRTLPNYAKLHWSIYWRMKYCFDFHPKNIPDYAIELLRDVNTDFGGAANNDLNVSGNFFEDNDELLKKIIDETREELELWGAQDWKVVPDDLEQVLKDFSYI